MFQRAQTPTTPAGAAGASQATIEPRPPASEEAALTRRLTDAPCATRLGRLQIRGSLTGSDSVELSGTFVGPITTEGLCLVHEGGRVEGQVTAADAVIAGDVQGRVTVRGRLEMRAHARVVADVEAVTIAIAEGCFIEGRIHMGGSRGAGQPTSFKEKRRGKRRAARASDPPGAQSSGS